MTFYQIIEGKDVICEGDTKDEAMKIAQDYYADQVSYGDYDTGIHVFDLIIREANMEDDNVLDEEWVLEIDKDTFEGGDIGQKAFV